MSRKQWEATLIRLREEGEALEHQSWTALQEVQDRVRSAECAVLEHSGQLREQTTTRVEAYTELMREQLRRQQQLLQQIEPEPRSASAPASDLEDHQGGDGEQAGEQREVPGGVAPCGEAAGSCPVVLALHLVGGEQAAVGSALLQAVVDEADVCMVAKRELQLLQQQAQRAAALQAELEAARKALAAAQRQRDTAAAQLKRANPLAPTDLLPSPAGRALAQGCGMMGPGYGELAAGSGDSCASAAAGEAVEGWLAGCVTEKLQQGSQGSADAVEGAEPSCAAWLSRAPAADSSPEGGSLGAAAQQALEERPLFRRYHLVASAAALSQWLDQHSPCCAAAAVAAAVNVLLRARRCGPAEAGAAAQRPDEPGGVTAGEVLELYASWARAELRLEVQRVAAVMQCEAEAVEALAAALCSQARAQMEATGRKKPHKGFARTFLRGLREERERERERLLGGDGARDAAAPGAAAGAGVRLDPSGHTSEEDRRPSAASPARHRDNGCVPSDGGAVEGAAVRQSGAAATEEGDSSASGAPSPAGSTSPASSACGSDAGAAEAGALLPESCAWLQAHAQAADALLRAPAAARAAASLLRRQLALHRLLQPSPSTAPIGTDRVVRAARALAAHRRLHASVWRFMGCAKARWQHRVSAGDSERQKAAQWQALLQLLQAPDAALLFHLQNHYSLIFAARQWTAQPRTDRGVADAARTTRQVLVAKPGQKPSLWMDFDSMRELLLSWTGYGVVALRAAPPLGSTSGVLVDAPPAQHPAP